MRSRLLILAVALLLAALTAPAGAGAATVVPRKVLVRFDRSATHIDRVRVAEATGTGSATPLPDGTCEMTIKDGATIARTLAELRAQPDVAGAHPDYVLHTASAAYFPDDPGAGGPGDWRDIQWNFAGKYGIHAPQAWARMRALDRDGGRGVVVAVIDTGVAYRDKTLVEGDKKHKYHRAPDLYRGRFVSGYDFFKGNRYPLDRDGHGTHVSGTIAEHVNNGQAVTGLAYGVRIMPIRVLGPHGQGNGSTFAQALYWATDHGADVINLSVEFPPELNKSDIPDVVSALDYAHRHGVVLVGAAGNDGGGHVVYPARDSHVIAVGASTSHGCRAYYSNTGSGLDITAPGGGHDSDPGSNVWDVKHCRPDQGGRFIYQQTFSQDSSPFGGFRLRGFAGTSESTPHVTAAAALVIASGVIGSHPSPGAVARRLEQTARDVGAANRDHRYGYGLLDAAAAVGG